MIGAMTQPQYEYIPATLADVGGMVDLVKLNNAANFPGVTPDITPQVMEAHLTGEWAADKRRKFETAVSGGKVLIQVARLGNDVIGFCGISGNEGWGIQVHPDHQRQGVGTNLVMELARRGAPENPQADITLETTPRTPSEEFFHRLGFQATGQAVPEDQLPVLNDG